MKVIKVPQAIWALGDAEQFTVSGVTTVVRPLYYRAPEGDGRTLRAGSINPDYAEPLMNQLLKQRS